MENLHLIVGLGNPGSEYARTRHNAGFLVVQRLAERCRVGLSYEKKFQARVGRADYGGRRLILCEPQTYMNSSGEAVAAVLGFYQVPLKGLLVVVDDADLPFGEIRLRAEGSSGGHHGLESIEQHLGTRQFARLRVGIGRTERGLREITGHVLGKFSAEEAEILEKVLERTAAQIECFLEEGVRKAMSQFNGSVIPAPVKKEEK